MGLSHVTSQSKGAATDVRTTSAGFSAQDYSCLYKQDQQQQLMPRKEVMEQRSYCFNGARLSSSVYVYPRPWKSSIASSAALRRAGAQTPLAAANSFALQLMMRYRHRGIAEGTEDLEEAVFTCSRMPEVLAHLYPRSQSYMRYINGIHAIDEFTADASKGLPTTETPFVSGGLYRSKSTAARSRRQSLCYPGEAVETYDWRHLYLVRRCGCYSRCRTHHRRRRLQRYAAPQQLYGSKRAVNVGGSGRFSQPLPRWGRKVFTMVQTVLGERHPQRTAAVAAEAVRPLLLRSRSLRPSWEARAAWLWQLCHRLHYLREGARCPHALPLLRRKFSTSTTHGAPSPAVISWGTPGVYGLYYHTNGDVSTQERRRHPRPSLRHVGRFYAIPGVPQPPPQRMSSGQKWRRLSASAKKRYLYTPISSRVAFGSVVSLHDYLCFLCPSYGGGSRIAKRKQHSTAAEDGDGHPHLNEGEGAKGAVSMHHSTAFQPLSLHSGARFTVPIALLSNTTSRAIIPPSMKERWSLPQCDLSSGGCATTELLPRQGSSNNSSGSRVEEVRSSLSQPFLEVLGGCNMKHVRHWSCIQMKEYLRHLDELMELPALLRGTTVLPDTPSSQREESMVMMMMQQPQVLRTFLYENSVGILLVHEHQWIYMSVLHHVSTASIDANNDFSGNAISGQSATTSASESTSRLRWNFKSDSMQRRFLFSELYSFSETPRVALVSDLIHAIQAAPAAEHSTLYPKHQSPQDGSRDTAPPSSLYQSLGLQLPQTTLVYISPDAQTVVQQLWQLARKRLRRNITQTLQLRQKYRRHHFRGSAKSAISTVEVGEGGSVVARRLLLLLAQRRQLWSHPAPSIKQSWRHSNDPLKAQGGGIAKDWHPIGSRVVQRRIAPIRQCRGPSPALSSWRRRLVQAQCMAEHEELLLSFLQGGDKNRTWLRNQRKYKRAMASWARRPQPASADIRRQEKKSQSRRRRRGWNQWTRSRATYISPLPPRGRMLRNPTLLLKPFQLAEELKYGRVVKYH